LAHYLSGDGASLTELGLEFKSTPLGAIGIRK
jgi:hypothetical protein